MKKSKLFFDAAGDWNPSGSKRGLYPDENRLICRRIFTLILTIAFLSMPFLETKAQVCVNDTLKGGIGIEGNLYANDGNADPTRGMVFTNDDDWFGPTDPFAPLNPALGIGIIGQGPETSVPTGLSALDFGASGALNNQTYVQRMAYPSLTPRFTSASTGYILLDAVAARDNYTFGGFNDNTTFGNGPSQTTGSNPNLWNISTGGVPANDDIVDVGGHLRRGYNFATNQFGDLFGYAYATTRSTSGASYLDFEIFRTSPYVQGNQLLNTGTDGGHTSTLFNPGSLTLNQPGDVLVSVNYSNGGSVATASVKVWIDPNNVDGQGIGTDWNDYNASSNAIYQFTGNFDQGDGAGTFCYAEIEPINPSANCVIVAVTNGTSATAPPWGSVLGNNFSNTLAPLQLAEVSINFSSFGLDIPPASGPCFNLFGSLMVKTRATSSFSSTMKDFCGPFEFGDFQEVNADAGPDMNISCNLTQVELVGVTTTPGATGTWSTTNGCIASQSGNTAIATCAGNYTFTVTNPNYSSCIATDEVVVSGVPDSDPPTLNLPSLPTISRNCFDQVPPAPTAIQDFENALNVVVSDISGPVVISSIDNVVISGSCNGQIERVFTLTDNCGNSSTFTQTINVDDNIPPIITNAPSDLNLGCNPSIPAPDLAAVSATDNCTNATISVLADAVTGDCEKTLVRTYVATDDCGNSTNYVQTITYKEDNQAPVITTKTSGGDIGCNPTPQQIEDALGSATAVDDCDQNLIVNESTGSVVSSGCNRSQTRTFSTEDECGNNATTATVTVTWTEDNAVPVITLDNPTAPTALGCNPSAQQIDNALGSATVADGCGGGALLTFVDGPVTGTPCARSQTRTWNAEDPCGNDAVAIIRTVTWKEDTQAADITLDAAPALSGCNPSNNDIDAALGSATASDNCDGNQPALFTDSNGQNGCQSTRTRTFTFTDACGNISATVTRTVSWTADQTAPDIQLIGTPGPIALGCNPTPQQIEDALGDATATDACGTFTPTFNDVTTGPPCARTTTRTWTVADGCGNNATPVSRQVSWKEDNAAPVINPIGPAGPIDMGCNPTQQDILSALGSANVSDDCDNLTASFSDATTNTGCNYTVVRTWDVTDLCGQAAQTVTRTVNYRMDTTAPVVSCGASASTIQFCDNGTNTVTFNPTATDDCDGTLSPVVTRSDGQALTAPFPIGTTQVVVSAFDQCNNTASCTTTVIVTVNPTCNIAAPANNPACGSAGNTLTGTVNNATSYSWSVTTNVVGATPWVITAGASSPTITYSAGSGSATFTLTAIAAGTNAACTTQCQITVSCIDGRFCTYTQGYYGNRGGMSCAGVTTAPLLNQMLGGGNDLTVGWVPTSRSLTFSQNDVTTSCLFKKLPGGGPSKLIEPGNHNCGTVPNTMLKRNGSLNNVLLSQTITLGLNLRVPGTSLGGLQITAPYLLTYGSDSAGCISTTASAVVSDQIVRTIPQSVINYLGASNTVNDLYIMANRALGGDLPAGAPSLSAFNRAVSAFNEAFDECRFFGGFYATDPLAPALIGNRAFEGNDDVIVLAYPNPVSDLTNIEFILNGYESDVIIEVFDLNGARVDAMNLGLAESDVPYRVQVDVSQYAPAVYFYHINTKKGVYTGKITVIK